MGGKIKVSQVKEDLNIIGALEEIDPKLFEGSDIAALKKKLEDSVKEDSYEYDSDDEELDFDTEVDGLVGELGPGQESYTNKYPDKDATADLVKSYDEFILGVKEKPFYKTIESYYSIYTSGALNFMERKFLWKFMKAISSSITHLLIEGEQKEESLILVEKYYDSLVTAMNRVIHAADKQDVIQSFNYMVEFLGIASQEEMSNSEEMAE